MQFGSYVRMQLPKHRQQTADDELAEIHDGDYTQVTPHRLSFFAQARDAAHSPPAALKAKAVTSPRTPKCPVVLAPLPVC